MTIYDFSVEEINLIAIYKADTKAETFDNIAKVFPDIGEDFRDVAEHCLGKLAMLTEPEFAEIPFTPADDTDEA